MTATDTSKMVTVFGGSGFLGRHVVRALANEGWRIRVATRNPNTAHYLRPMGRVGQIQLVKANVLNEAEVAAALRGAHAVVNLVGILQPSGRQRFVAIHVAAAERIARLAKLENVARLIHFSAIGASQDAKARYFGSKAQGETAVRGAFTNATIFRPAVVFGPEDNFFNRFASLARIAPILPLFDGGVTRFQPVFVGDVAQAVAASLQESTTEGQIFELAGPQIMTFREVLEYVMRETHRKRWLVHLPLALARFQGAILQWLPRAALTYDQALMLETDTVKADAMPGLRALGITPTGIQAIVPSYLWRFRKRGQFETALHSRP